MSENYVVIIYNNYLMIFRHSLHKGNWRTTGLVGVIWTVTLTFARHCLQYRILYKTKRATYFKMYKTMFTYQIIIFYIFWFSLVLPRLSYLCLPRYKIRVTVQLAATISCYTFEISVKHCSYLVCSRAKYSGNSQSTWLLFVLESNSNSLKIHEMITQII